MPEALTSNPLVSVIIPTYNRAHLILDSVQSVLQQTYENWELIIVDDGSNDDTEKVIHQIENAKISYFKIEHSGILGKVRNYGIKISNGEYIAFLDSDDIWRKDKLMFQLELFKKHDISFTLSNGSHFGELVTVQPPEFENLIVGNLFLSLIVEHKFVVYMPSLIFKKEIFTSVDMINEDMKSGGDIEFIYRMAHAFNGAFSNERLVSIRKHGEGMSSKYAETAYVEDLKIVSSFFKKGALSKKHYDTLTAMFYYKLGLFNLDQLPGRASQFFFKHNMLRPLNYKGWLRLLQAILKNLFHKNDAIERG
jgi:glycosyltransferase involved in cell wall biosynthesis